MLTLATLLLAQTPTRLPETVVVETRQPSPLAEASPSVTRLDVTTANESGLNTLAGLLATSPGIYATEQSGEGSQASLFVRGTNSSQTALLLDGRRLPQGFSNSYEIGRYRVFGLSSVEILRGSASTLYGANAIGGVIDLRLPEPLTGKKGSEFVAEAGSFGRGYLGLTTLWNNAAEKGQATQGTTATVTTLHDDGWRDNGTRDSSTAFLKSDWRLSPHLVFDLIGTADWAKAGLPGAALTTPGTGDPNDWQKDSGWMLSPGFRYEDDSLRATLFWSHGGSAVTSFVDGSNFFGPYTYYQRFLLARDEFTAFADWKLTNRLSLGLGASYERNAFDQLALDGTSTTWAETFESFGLWTQADWRVTSTDRLHAAVRRDHFSAFADKTIGDFSYARTLSKELAFTTKVGTAYRAPAASDLAYNPIGATPLRPEASTSYEAGLRYENSVPNALSWTLVAFQNDLKDLIDYDPANFQTYNIAAVRARGIEFGFSARPAKGLKTFGAATWLNTSVQSALGYQSTAAQGESLLRRPDLCLSLGAEVMPSEDWTVGISINHLRGRMDFDWNTNTRVALPNASFTRLWIRWALSERTELSLRIENLLGETAPPTALGYGAQPRSAYLGLTGKF